MFTFINIYHILFIYRIGECKKEKVDILREDIIHNFLKQTIFRIDYDYLFPNQISQLMENLDAFFSEKNLE